MAKSKDTESKCPPFTADCKNCLSTTGNVESMCRGCLIPQAAPQKDRAHSNWLPKDDATAKFFAKDNAATVDSVRLNRGLA